MVNKSQIKEFAIVGAGQGAPQKESDFSAEGIPFIRAGHIEDLLNGMAEMELPKVNSEIAKSYRLKLYPSNTIVFAKSGMSALKGRIYKLKNPCYVVNHLATLELNENAFPDYIVYALRYFSPVRLINDSSYPSLKQSKIETYEIPFPKSINEQIQIATILSRAETLIKQRKQSIVLLDEYLRCTFGEMFGDTMTNKKKWDKIELRNFGEIITGNTPPRSDAKNYTSNFIEWIKTDNITSENTYITRAAEYLSEKGLQSARTVTNGALLVACIAGSIESVGRAALTNRKVSFNQQINAVQPNKEISPMFLYWLFKVSKKYIQDSASSGMKKILTKGSFEKIKMITPPFELQNQFAQLVEKSEIIREQYKNSLQDLENLYGSLSQQAFKRELRI